MTDRFPGVARGLSAPLAPIIGRKTEIADVCALLQRPSVSLLTLTGPAGAGKTRLALEVAALLEAEFADGLIFVSLASVTEPALVIPSLAQALGVPDGGERSLIERVADSIAGRSLLLVLDNFEPVVAAAPDLVRVIAGSTRSKALVTSRVVLRVSGEQEFHVPPMHVPRSDGPVDLGEIAQAESVALFLQRAQAANPGFALSDANVAAVLELCRRLDGLPLAIELAAARVKILSPQAMLARLSNRWQLLAGGVRDAPLRLQSMRDAISWSYDLLDLEEQALFRRLSVFAGGLSLDAAESVVRLEEDAQIDDIAILDGVSSLVDKSLLRIGDGPSGEMRFSMLETIRQFGLEQLDEQGESSTSHDRHGEWFTNLARELQPERSSGAQAENAIHKLESEHDNLRAALAWYDASQQSGRLLDLASALGWFWQSRGHLSEGQRWLERAIDASQPGTPDASRMILALGAAGEIAGNLADYQRARDLLGQMRDLCEATGDQLGLGRALLNLGVVAERQRDDPEAISLFSRSLEIFRAVGYPAGLVIALFDLGDAEFRSGDLARSAAYSEEALKESYALGDKALISISLGNQAQLALATRDFRQAVASYQQSLALATEVENSWLIADALAGLAGVAAAADEHRLGARWLSVADAICDSIGTPDVPHYEQRARTLAALTSALAPSELDEIRLETRALRSGAAVDEALAWTWNADSIATAGAKSDRPAAQFALTERELDVLRLLADGRSTKQISEQLFISPRTATTHVANILHKMDVNSRSSAVALAFQHGIV